MFQVLFSSLEVYFFELVTAPKNLHNFLELDASSSINLLPHPSLSTEPPPCKQSTYLLATSHSIVCFIFFLYLAVKLQFSVWHRPHRRATRASENHDHLLFMVVWFYLLFSLACCSWVRYGHFNQGVGNGVQLPSFYNNKQVKLRLTMTSRRKKELRKNFF